MNSFDFENVFILLCLYIYGAGRVGRKNPQRLIILSQRSHLRLLVGKRTALKDAIKDITSDSQVNSYFPNRWSPASLTFNIKDIDIITFVRRSLNFIGGILT